MAESVPEQQVQQSPVDASVVDHAPLAEDTVVEQATDGASSQPPSVKDAEENLPDLEEPATEHTEVAEHTPAFSAEQPQTEAPSDATQNETTQDASETSNTDQAQNPDVNGNTTDSVEPELFVPTSDVQVASSESDKEAEDDVELPDAPPLNGTTSSEEPVSAKIDTPESKLESKPETNGIASNSTDTPSTGSIALSTEVNEAKKRSLEEEARSFLVEQTNPVIMPSYAAWFDMTKTNDIERKSLPEFFNNRNRSKTPTVYRDYRDFMINTYRLNPIEYLTVTACRRNLAGDVCAIMRVHAFLEQWGLINYQIDPDTRPSSVGPPFTGHFRVIADTPRGLEPFQPGPGSFQSGGHTHPGTLPPAIPPPPVKPNLNLEIRRSFYENSSTVLASDTPNGNVRKTYNCFTCGNDCTRVRYHSMKNKQFDLCANCFLENRFPATSQTSDFVKFEETDYLAADRDREWTEQETLLLLEGLELYDEDWNAIAEHVSTRTREQCVLKFLQLPIEDPYLETKPEELGPLQYSHIPLSQADNPVMSVVAFLASIVDPEVAAAAAQSALPKMTEAIKNQIKKNSGEPEIDASKDLGDKMDVDEESTKKEETEDIAKEDGNKEGGDNGTVKKAASIALGVAAARAHLLATDEEREMSRLVNSLVSMQQRKLELKLAKFNELEQVLEAERRALEQDRQQLFLDRLEFQKEVNAFRAEQRG
ncbi:hypothetical protein V1514DRAFT_352788 [Lipomyces japonicus]|uniref:uncharacterized protein n=1 Tax=Lipomyces japonicus TaxID=56871 RepID=UPI0034CDE798